MSKSNPEIKVNFISLHTVERCMWLNIGRCYISNWFTTILWGKLIRSLYHSFVLGAPHNKRNKEQQIRISTYQNCVLYNTWFLIGWNFLFFVPCSFYCSLYWGWPELEPKRLWGLTIRFNDYIFIFTHLYLRLILTAILSIILCKNPTR